MLKQFVKGSSRVGEERLKVAEEGLRVTGGERGVMTQRPRAAVDSAGSGGGAPMH